MPYRDVGDTGNFMEELAAAGRTEELKQALGAMPDITNPHAVAQLFEESVRRQDRTGLTVPGVAVAAATFLRDYGKNAAFNADQVRMAITQKLMEIANCGDPKYELRALELLGKHVDIGLFTTKSELTVKYEDPERLEQAIKDRVKTLLNAEVIEVEPLHKNLDDVFGIAEVEDNMPPGLLDSAVAREIRQEVEDSFDD